MFSTQSENCIPIVDIFDIISLSADLEEPKIGIAGKGLNGVYKGIQIKILARDIGFITKKTRSS